MISKVSSIGKWEVYKDLTLSGNETVLMPYKGKVIMSDWWYDFYNKPFRKLIQKLAKL